MTFKSWEERHNKKVAKILTKLGDISDREITKYFMFDNMVERETDFCPLYRTNTKCHDMKDLNCYLCGCPFFAYSDEEPLRTNEGVKIMSTCIINSQDAQSFTVDQVQQCDCSKCEIPHKPKFVERHLALTETDNPAEDAISTLEWLRGLQLSDIFGKWKLF